MEPLVSVPEDRTALRVQVRATLARLSQTGELPTLPATASAALAIARDPDADIDDLARVLQADLGLAARMLRSANSPALGRRTPARKLSEAIITLGLRETCNLLVATCAHRLYAVPLPGAERLWDHALAAAVATETLAAHTRAYDPSDVFLMGLFHDVGRIAFLMADPTASQVIATLAASSDTEASQLEREWYGFDHAEASAMLAEDWGIPSDHCDAIRWHHVPDHPAGGPLARILNGADALAYGIGCGGAPTAPATISLVHVGIDDPETTAALVEQVRAAWSRQREVVS